MSAAAVGQASPLKSASEFWLQVGSVQPGQKLTTSASAGAGQGAVTVSRGSNSSWTGWAIQAITRLYDSQCRKMPANRQATLVRLKTASDANPALFQSLAIALQNPGIDGDSFIALMKTVMKDGKRLKDLLDQAVFGMSCLAVTYKKDPNIKAELVRLQKRVAEQASLGLQMVENACRAQLNPRLCRQTLRAIADSVNGSAAGYLWMGTEQLPDPLRPLVRSKGGYFAANTATVRELMMGKGVNMKLVPFEGSANGQMIPNQMNLDLPRLGMITLQGEVLYDNRSPKVYSPANLYSALQKILGGDIAITRIGALLTQASLAELTMKVIQIGGQVKPVIAQGGSQDIALAVKDGMLSLVHSIPFTLRDMENIEVAVGNVKAVRNVLLPLNILTKNDEEYAKAVTEITVIDQFETNFSNKAWAPKIPAPAPLAVQGAQPAAVSAAALPSAASAAASPPK